MNVFHLIVHSIVIRKSLITESSFLAKNVNNPRNYGMFETQSCNTLQNSIKAFSIPKGSRFKLNIEHHDSDNLYTIPSIKSNKGTCMGYGGRTDFTKLNGKGNPSPDTYTLPSSLNKNNAATLKFRIPDMSISNKSKIPSPGDYNILLKNTTLPTTLKFRHGLYYEDELKLKCNGVSPQTYTPNYGSVLSSRYNSVKFNIQQRVTNEVNKEIKKNPGPGYYNLPSVFDLSRKFKPCIN